MVEKAPAWSWVLSLIHTTVQCWSRDLHCWAIVFGLGDTRTLRSECSGDWFGASQQTFFSNEPSTEVGQSGCRTHGPNVGPFLLSGLSFSPCALGFKVYAALKYKLCIFFFYSQKLICLIMKSCHTPCFRLQWGLMSILLVRSWECSVSKSHEISLCTVAFSHKF